MGVKGWPYCMKKKRPPKQCSICRAKREQLLDKGMPGLYKGKCFKHYVLARRYKSNDIVRMVYAKIELGRARVRLKKAVRAIA